MYNPKNIPQPSLESAVELKPLQLNNIRIGKKHTVLTPEQLEKIKG